MAQGSFTGTTSNQYVQPKITWSSVSNIAGNYSDVTATLTYSRTNTGYTTSGHWNGSITVNGTTVSKRTSGEISIGYNSNTVAMQCTVRVPHNSDGSKTISISCTGNIPAASLSNTQCSKSNVALDIIPRAATITSAPNFTDNSSPTVNYSNKAGNSVSSLQIGIALNNNSDVTSADISYRDVSKTGTAYTFNFIPTEKDAMRNALMDSTNKGSKQVTFILKTVISGTTYYSRYVKTLTIEETESTKPTVSISRIEPTNSPQGFSGLYIQNITGFKIDYSAQAKYSSSISSYTTKTSDATEEKTTPTYTRASALTQAGDFEIIGTVTDVCGFTNTVSQIISVIPYAKPYIAPAENETGIICTRCNANGVIVPYGIYLKIKLKRFYSKIMSGDTQNNYCEVEMRHKESTASAFSNWETVLTFDSSTDTADLILPSIVSDIKKSYYIEIRAVDDLTTDGTSILFKVLSDTVTLDLNENGDGVGIGKYNEKTGYLEIAYNTEIKGIDHTITEQEYDELASMLGVSGTPRKLYKIIKKIVESI